MTENQTETVQHCTCGLHCRTNCPYLVVKIEEGSEPKCYCGEYHRWLVRDPHFIRYNMILFCRVRECRLERINYHQEHRPRNECRAVN